MSRSWFRLAIAALFAAVLAFAQTTTGSISGSVSDTSGARVAGANVRLTKQVIGGWQLNGIMTVQSGQPFNITSGKDSNVDGNNNDRPDLAGDPRLTGDRSRAALIREFFNVDAFAPAAGLYGTAGRNLLLRPGEVNWNISAFKEFATFESQKLQFRADVFNVFNQVNFGNPNGTMSSPNFGKIRSAGSPRILQFGLKYLF